MPKSLPDLAWRERLPGATTGRPSRHGPPGSHSDPVNARCRGTTANALIA